MVTIAFKPEMLFGDEGACPDVYLDLSFSSNLGSSNSLFSSTFREDTQSEQSSVSLLSRRP